ncbi:MAG TPA: hypothetical protein VKN99_24065, partial [Polyangia bacterium]|nr:hypothetical protein [Polyangia bacterium]
MPLRRTVLAGLLMAGCSFDASGSASPGDGAPPADRADGLGGGDRPTGDVIAGLGVVHVPHDGQFTGSGDLIFSGTVTITTGPGTPTISSGIPSGVRFDVWPQECPCGSPSCPELAVIHTQQFVVNAGATVRVTGSRPLVVIASSNVLVDGLLDAGGHLTAPGPGGAAAGAGPGAGGAGQSNGTNDAGGGGAGFGQVGAAGGDATMPSSRARGGGGGAEYDAPEVNVLQGGSGGGNGSPGACSPGSEGGAGGGALELFSLTTIQTGVNGAIHVGGGGGSGGADCSNDGGGGGGGSGGALVLQAPLV